MDKLTGVVLIDYGNPSSRFDYLPQVDSACGCCKNQSTIFIFVSAAAATAHDDRRREIETLIERDDDATLPRSIEERMQ